jgi:hypothetical protein
MGPFRLTTSAKEPKSIYSNATTEDGHRDGIIKERDVSDEMTPIQQKKSEETSFLESNERMEGKEEKEDFVPI